MQKEGCYKFGIVVCVSGCGIVALKQMDGKYGGSCYVWLHLLSKSIRSFPNRCKAFLVYDYSINCLCRGFFKVFNFTF